MKFHVSFTTVSQIIQHFGLRGTLGKLKEICRFSTCQASCLPAPLLQNAKDFFMGTCLYDLPMFMPFQ